MHKKVKKLLVWSLVVSMVLTNMLFSNLAFAATKSSALASARLAGADRYQTAVEISKAEWTTSQYAVLAYGEGFADALAAAPLAGKYDAPILLTAKDSLPAVVLAELQRLGVKNVFIVGGEGVVSKAVADALVAAGMTPERLAGADRYATALAVANKLGTTTEVVVAYGEGFADALSISAIAAAKGMPILLTDKGAMSADVKAYIGAKKAYVVGGEGVVSAAVFNGLTGAVRLSGADRYATNLAVLQQFAANLNWLNVFVATGEGFADALAGSALAARYGSPVVLADSALAAATSSFLAGKVNSQTGVIAFGGVAVVSDAVVGSVKPAAPATFGVDSVTTMGLNGIKIVFSQEVDKDQAIKVANYAIDGIYLSDTKAVAALASDKKTLTIVLEDKIDQYKKVLFTIADKSVYTKDMLTTIPKTEKELVFSDTTVPAVQSVSITGNKKLTVQFTEPVKMSTASGLVIDGAGQLFKIDGQYLSNYGFIDGKATTLTASDFGYKLDLNFDVAIPTGAHTLKILKGSATNFSDAAGYNVAETDIPFTVDSVTTAPQVVSVTAETNGVVYVTYDRAMDATTAKAAGNYKANGNAVKDGFVPSFKDGSGDKIVKLQFNTADVNEGANVLEVAYGVKDAYGNKLHADTNQRFSFSAVKDTVKPTVTSVVLVDNKSIRVKFSEDVAQAYAGSKSNYTLKKSSGETIEIYEIVKTSDDTYTVKTDDNNKLTGSGYTLKIKNVIDLANPANTMDEYVATVSGKDDVAPSVSAVVIAGDSKIAVYFNEGMDVATISDKANYAYLTDKATTETKTLPSSANIVVGEGNKYVTIEFPTGYQTTTVTTATASSYKVSGMRIANVKDAAGNVLDGISVSVRAVLAASAGVSNPKYSANTFKLFADSTKAWAEFELDQTLTTFVKGDFNINTVTPDTGYVAGKKVVLEFSKDSGKRALIMAMGPDAKLYADGTIGSTNISGIKLAAITEGKPVYDEQIKPEWDSVVGTPTAASTTINTIAAGTTVVVLTFSENIDGSIAGLYKDDFTFTTSDGVLLTVKNVEVVDNEIYFSFKEDVATSGVKVTVKAQASKIDIKDIKDTGAEDQNLYVPTSGQITGKTSL